MLHLEKFSNFEALLLSQYRAEGTKNYAWCIAPHENNPLPSICNIVAEYIPVYKLFAKPLPKLCVYLWQTVCK